MIDIDSAIIESKNKENISDGGSKCYDFGDVVLVKYSCPIKYLRNGERSREKSEEIMESINMKASNGVNTPKHIAVKRVIEGENDVCYVLQQKCPGFNCASFCEYGVSFEEMCEDLKFVINIPFEHYKKLIEDGFQLFEMGYEAKNKNLFYDKDSGFWFIDFLDNEIDYVFDKNDIKKVFEALLHRIPQPFQIASRVRFDYNYNEEQLEIKNNLEFGIKAKTLLAIREVLPPFKKYEKFYLADETDEYKEYLMKEGIVNTNLKALDENDYDTFNELYEIIINGLIDKVANKEDAFWNIEVNAIRNDSNIFKLSKIWEMHKENTFKRDEFESIYDYEYEVENQLQTKILYDLIERLKKIEGNQNVDKFLEEASNKLDLENNKHR